MKRHALMVAKEIAAGRVLFGLACLIAPRKVMSPAGKSAEGQLIWMVRAFGVRDIVLGTGTLIGLRDGESGKRWVQLSAAADTMDVANAVIFGKELERRGVVATLSLAVPATVGGWWAARNLSEG